MKPTTIIEDGLMRCQCCGSSEQLPTGVPFEAFLETAERFRATHEACSQPETTQITSIRYGELVNTGDYEHMRMEAEAQVNPGQDPVVVSDLLKKFVQEQMRKI